MIKAIIFDLDNTLMDFLKFKKVCCSAAVDAMVKAGLKLSREKTFSEIYKIYDTHTMEDSLVFQRFLEQHYGEIDYHKLASAIIAYRKARVGVMKPYPRVKNTLRSLKKKGLKLAIVTDAPKLKAWLRLTSAGIADYFDFVVAQEDTGRFKPSKLPFKTAIKKLEVLPYECLMVGDNHERDVIGANAIGMKSCWAKYGAKHKVKNSKADYEIIDISELLELV